MDAFSRATGKPNYPPQEPSTKTIQVKNRSQCKLYLSKGKVCDMEIYMHRPEELHYLKFEDFYKIWHYVDVQPKEDTEFYTLTLAEVKKPRYLLKWTNISGHLVRINMMYPSAGDIYYLRIIIKNRAITSWEDALIVEGKAYKTYQDAARAAKYLDDENEAFLCFSEALATLGTKSSSLRGLFVLLTIDGYPSLNILSDATFIKAMTADYHKNDPIWLARRCL
jgi:hypothetical protein